MDPSLPYACFQPTITCKTSPNVALLESCYEFLCKGGGAYRTLLVDNNLLVPHFVQFAKQAGEGSEISYY